jgi:penicillin-binding protein 2
MNDNRKYIILAAFVGIGIIFIVRLFSIQVSDSHYRLAAENNVVSRVTEYPYRGLIKDRHGKILVQNVPVFDLMVVPKEVRVADTVRFCQLLNITKEDFEKRIRDARSYSYVKPSAFYKQISLTEFARIQDQLVDFKGFYIDARTIREYPDSLMANALGYIGEISKNQLARDSSRYYKQGDYIGISGVESHYEKMLRGKRGVRYRLVNVRGIEKGSFKSGRFDTLAIPGDNLITGIDRDLQAYGEYLMGGKVGSIVAIEPSSGDILSMISSPSYNPNLLTGRNFSSNFAALQRDSLKPLFNRPLMAQYRPGSVFKLVQSLIALQEGVIFPETRHLCTRHIINCHGAHTNEDLHGAIKFSCNPYFYQTFRKIINQRNDPNTFIDSRIGLERWNDYLDRMGLGRTLGVDIPNETRGLIPAPAYYDRWYGRNRWAFSTIYSLSIGEGEILVTPVQMANLAAIIANRGYFYTPHIVKGMEQDGDRFQFSFERQETGIDSIHFSTVVNAMAEIVYGTARIAAVPDVIICGKTGTVQNKNAFDHSVFMAFAPKDNPQIAIAVYVENAGWGGGVAAAIAGLMIEQYLKGDISRQKKWVEDYVMEQRYLRNLKL